MHVSFSQGGALKSEKRAKNRSVANIPTDFIGNILKGFGVTLTELQDVVFKFTQFKRSDRLYTQEQISEELSSHYTNELMKQFYVIFLGLDIIGNPYGLARKLTIGIKDFISQLFHGAARGPEELVEGVSIGSKSLCSNLVDGASGAASRIVGTLGKGVAILTLDEDYQRKRQETLNQKPDNVCEGLARGAKGILTNTYSGVAGVVLKPIEGARKDGVGGLAKGVGIGLIGMVTRPISGLVDCVSGTFDAMKRCEGRPVRAPRNMSDYIYRPFKLDAIHRMPYC